MKKKQFVFSTTQLILMSFLVAILVGSFLLSLPVSSADGNGVSYIDALFTAATSVCVTGLVTLPTYSAWSFFGQVVILILIQIGGLGIITVMSMIMIILQRKIGIGDRVLLQDAFNLSSLSGLVRFVRRVVLGTFAVEGIGALLYMSVFVPQFGLKGIWFSLFNAVSAFCNAGIDVIGADSLCPYAVNPIINFVTCTLIILGGIGFPLWWDVIRVFKDNGRKKWYSLTLQSKLALSVTAFLITFGTIAFLIFEYNNPLTLKGMDFFDKLQLSLFQSVTTRTAGFMTIPQENLTDASAFLSLMLMFTGGSPVGTAGGIKTVTLAVLVVAAVSAVKNKDEVSVFGRTVSKQIIVKSVGVVMLSFATVCISTLILFFVTDAEGLDILYETVSATATVGLSRNLTPSLNLWGKLAIIVTMYLGRVGPISLAIAFGMKKKNESIIKNPVEDVSVG